MTVIYFTDPQELVDMGYNFHDCSAEFVCEVMEDGAVYPPCQQAVMYQAWECDPDPFIPEEPDHDIRPPYIPAETVSATDTAQAVDQPVLETEAVIEQAVVPVRSEMPVDATSGFVLTGMVALVSFLMRILR